MTDWASRARQLAAAAKAAADAAEAENERLVLEVVDDIHALQPLPRATLWTLEFVQSLMRGQNGKCPACGEPVFLGGRNHHIDHVIPWALGGGNETANIQVLHARCNLQKGSAVPLDQLLDYLEGRARNIT
jgi:5-methylcytosine-specific restriction endonuclease McrA